MNKTFKTLCTTLVVVCLVLQTFLFTGCLRSVYEYDQERSNIVSIEIVEANYSFETGCGTQSVLLTIDDIDDFLDKIENIKYSESFSSPGTIEKRTLAVKLSYENGNYEIFDANNKSSVISENGGFYQGRIFGSFDETFYDMIFDYLSAVEKCRYNYMHDVSEIESIEIVKSTAGYNSLSYNTITTISDKAAFIEQLNDIDYVYTNDEICDGVYDYRDQDLAIRIVYKNGNYEVYNYNHRDEVQIVNDSIRYRTGTYIGTFDKIQFEELVDKYLNSN